VGFADFNSVGVRPFGVRGGFDSLALPPLNLTVSSRDPDYFLVGVSLRLLPVCYPTSDLPQIVVPVAMLLPDARFVA